LLEAVKRSLGGKSFQFFLPPPKSVPLTRNSIFPEAKKVVFHTIQASVPLRGTQFFQRQKKAHCEIEFPVRETGFGVNKKNSPSYKEEEKECRKIYS
jgi:hypothetical protein